MVRAKRFASYAVAVVAALSFQAPSAYIEQDRPRRIRETALGDGTILSALLPDDDVVEISWPREAQREFQTGDSSIEQLQLSAKKGPFSAAIVTVTSVSGALVQDNKWIHTRFIATVNKVIVTAPGVAERNRITRDQTIEFRTRTGEVLIGGVTVRAGMQGSYPAGRQYLVFLGQRQNDNAWAIYNRAPLLIEGERVRFPSVEPVENALSGMLLSDITRALQGGGRVFLPRDQSAEDREFGVWVERLRTAAETGDLAALRDACTPMMKVHFDEVSRESVIGALVEGRPWRALRDALRLGVVRMDRIFAAPYTYTFADDDLNYGEVAITGRGVYMRRAPEPTAPVVGALWLSIVKEDQSHNFDSGRFENEDNPTGGDAWAKVTAPNGAKGYVYGRYVREFLALRFIFERVDGQWKLTGFAAGD